MRVLALLFVLCLPLATYAGDEPHTLADVAEEVTASMKTLNQYMITVMNVIGDCEIDQVCVNNKVDELAADESNPAHVYWVALKQELDRTKEEDLKANEKCKVAPALEVKKVLAGCLKQTAQRMVDFPNEEEEHFLNTCLMDAVKPLAESGNVFALYVMCDMDSENAASWQTKLDAQKGSEFYDLANECKTNI